MAHKHTYINMQGDRQGEGGKAERDRERQTERDRQRQTERGRESKLRLCQHEIASSPFNQPITAVDGAEHVK